jgi:hypothetical protein
MWEDDTVACSQTLPFIQSSIAVLDTLDPLWGGLKVGNRGSGHVFRADTVTPLLVYLQTRRESDNIDVSMWRFLQAMGLPEYISRYSRGAHRGLLSSLTATQGNVWTAVSCASPLDFWWGYYTPCDFSNTATGMVHRTLAALEADTEGLDDEMVALRREVYLSMAPGEAQAQAEAHASLVKFIMDAWQCSMFSVGGELRTDTRPGWMKVGGK